MIGRMRGIWKSLKRRLRSTDAQDLVEYALLLMMVGLAAVASIKSVAGAIKNSFTQGIVQMAELPAPGNGTGTVSVANSSVAAVDQVAATVNNNSAAAAFNAAFNASSVNAALDDLAAAAAFAAAGLADQAAAADASSSTAAQQARAATQINNANADTAQASRDAAAAAAGSLTGFLF